MRVSFGDCELDTERRLLQRGGEVVHLSPKAFAVLELLVAERPRAVSKKALLDRVWADVVVEEQNVKNAIVEIRAALGADEVAIRTVQRFGYAFAGETTPPAHGPAIVARLLAEDRVYDLREGDNVIGRNGACEIAVMATGVSRRHARICLSAGVAILEDLASRNGTWVNDQRVNEPVQLRDRDPIRVGVVKLIYRSGKTTDTTTVL